VYAIARSPTWTAGKPIFFAFLAAPFVSVVGVNAGMIFASFIGTAFYLWMVALALPRLNRHCGVDPDLMPMEFALVALNPLSIYQFWSAYPDSLFAGLVVLAFILVDIVATEPERDTRWHLAGLGLAIFLAIHTKLYGAVLVLTCVAYFLICARQFLTRSSHRVAKIVILAIVFAVIAAVLVAMEYGVYPLLDLSDGGAYPSYVAALTHGSIHDIRTSLITLCFAVILAFQAALLFLATRAAWRALGVAPTLFIAIYLLGLLTFPGTSYNMRYFLPGFPFLAPVLAAGAQSFGPIVRRTILGAYGAIALVLILNFNFAPVERAFQPAVSKIYARHPHLYPRVDNLRLPTQMAIKGQIDAINAEVPQGSVLYWSSNYYGTATHGLAEYLGVKKGLDIRYILEPTDIPAASGPILLTQFSAWPPEDILRQAPDWATVTPLGKGLFRLDPKPQSATLTMN
jgi:hypothetical protein